MRRADAVRDVESVDPAFRAQRVDDLVLRLQRIGSEMDEFKELLARQPMGGFFRNLQATTDRIGSAFPRRPVEHPRYAAQWSEFESGRAGSLDDGTVRYLCWQPEIATTERFLTRVLASGVRLSSRPLAGLVRSCHHRWVGSFPGSPSAEMAKSLVSRYCGQSPVILKWKSNLDGVLGIQGPETLGRALAEEKRKLAALVDEWYLDSRSPFVRGVVEAAAAVCREELGRPTRDLIEFLFGGLLSWPGWEPRHFRKEVAELILHGAVTGQTREVLQRFILMSPHLGDPRLEGNRAKWEEMPEAARERMRLWLAENPFRLLEQVYREGRGWTVRPQDRQRKKAYG